jgi:hypothetical protein
MHINDAFGAQDGVGAIIASLPADSDHFGTVSFWEQELGAFARAVRLSPFFQPTQTLT